MTQRGNRRGRVFFSDADHQAYLDWLREYSTEHEVEVLAYCLMTNHVHLVVVPATGDALQRALRSLQSRYAQRVNRAKDWKGHVWQGRFFSSVLDESYCWAAIRYVERNPVRAGLVEQAEDYAWSSARAHCGLGVDPVLSTNPQWLRWFDGVGDWSAWLAEGDAIQSLETIRRQVARGLPCGSDAFIDQLEASSGRILREKLLGRPWPSRGGATKA